MSEWRRHDKNLNSRRVLVKKGEAGALTRNPNSAPVRRQCPSREGAGGPRFTGRRLASLLQLHADDLNSRRLIGAACTTSHRTGTPTCTCLSLSMLLCISKHGAGARLDHRVSSTVSPSSHRRSTPPATRNSSYRRGGGGMHEPFVPQPSPIALCCCFLPPRPHTSLATRSTANAAPDSAVARTGDIQQTFRQNCDHLHPCQPLISGGSRDVGACGYPAVIS